MTSPRRVDHEGRIGDLLARHIDDVSGSGDSCPDPNDLARYADGRGSPEFRSRIDSHLGGCAACRESAFDAAPPAGARRWRIGLAAAAAALLLFGAAAVLYRSGSDGRDPSRLLAGGDVDGAVAALDRAGRGDGLLEIGLPEPPGLRAAKLEKALESLRGEEVSSVRLVSPRARIRSGRPRFEWTSDEPGAPLALTVLDSEGAAVQGPELASSPWDWPADRAALPSGARFHWTLEHPATGARFGPLFFDVIEAERAAAIEAALLRIRAAAADPLSAHFVRANLFLREGLPAEARPELDSLLALAPHSRFVLECLAIVHSELGDRAAVAEDRKRLSGPGAR